MQSELLETTRAGQRQDGKRTGWRARAEAPTDRSAGKARAFRQLPASVSPVINTGRHRGSQHENRTGERARLGRPEGTWRQAPPLPHDPPYNRSAGAAVPTLNGNNNTALSRLHNSRQNAVDLNPATGAVEVATVTALHISADSTHVQSRRLLRTSDGSFQKRKHTTEKPVKNSGNSGGTPTQNPDESWPLLDPPVPRV
jgi:hypothetical protein